ncbi:hypothetical protein D9M70_602610 [compost metagenome]
MFCATCRNSGAVLLDPLATTPNDASSGVFPSQPVVDAPAIPVKFLRRSPSSENPAIPTAANMMPAMTTVEDFIDTPDASPSHKTAREGAVSKGNIASG